MEKSTPGRVRGFVDTTIWYLEMFETPAGPPLQPPDENLEIVRARHMTTRFYRYLYDNVGGDWLWTSRRLLSDEELSAQIAKSSVDLRVLWQGGVPAGYAEIDLREPEDVELVYFGLMPEAIGKGLGRYFLDWTVRHAFVSGASRFWVHTCDLDHPRARGTYEACGFQHYDTEQARECVLVDTPLPVHAKHRTVQSAG